MKPNKDSKYQTRINRHLETIRELQIALEHRNIYRATANSFFRKLLKENRVTKEELREYFKPLKEYKSLPEIE